MDNGPNILEAILNESSEDVEMLDVEEGEVVEEKVAHNDLGQTTDGSVTEENKVSSGSKNKRRRKNKKKNKKKKGISDSNVTDINRFVLDVCRRLREKKSYLVYTAVGCLGISALSDLVKEVEAIQACGGQKTNDGNRFRTGGGVLWNILKTREPNAYREIMKKGKEFEKQFRLPSKGGPTPPANKTTSQSESPLAIGNNLLTADITSPKPSPPMEEEQNHQQQTEEQIIDAEEMKKKSVRERIRVPVSYDDDILGQGPNDCKP